MAIDLVPTLLDPWVILAVFGGVALGLVWGALPGLSTVMAIALLTGLTYDLSLTVALAFLLSAYIGSAYGGAMSAILINIPGTPDSVPTQMAGHPLTRRGEGGLAIGNSLIYAVIGGWIGAGMLMLVAPFMVEFAMGFTSWEIALLAFVGVFIAGTLTAGSAPIKGWLAGFAGLLLAMAGRDSQSGEIRFDVGMPFMSDGIPFLPALVGLFGLCEIVRVLRKSSQDRTVPDMGKVLPSPRFVARYWRAGLRSGILGTVIGAIPGGGANLTTFFCYRLGEQRAKRDFSKGDHEGVVCGETSGNANIGGGLLPTLTLGIPGNNSTAIMMAALLLHGVRLGPEVESSSPGLLSYVYAILFLGSFAMLVVGFLLIRPIVRMFALPHHVVMPFVAVFTLLGTYLYNSNMWHVTLMFAFGVVGYLLLKADIPFAPLVLGLILGPILDDNLRRALQVHDGALGSMVTQPVSIVLLLVCAWSLWHGLRSMKPAVPAQETTNGTLLKRLTGRKK